MLNTARRRGNPLVNTCLTVLKLTFEVKEMAFSSADTLALADNDGSQNLLSELGLTLLD